MQWLDWLVCFTYLGMLTGIGVYFSKQQSSLEDFIRGRQRTSWLAIGFSLMAALNSGTDYIQTPTIVFVFGSVYSALVLTWIPLYFWVTRVTIPFYQKMEVYSAYEYLEQRFGLELRLAAATTFVLWRIGWMSVALYIPCLALKVTIGGELDITWVVITLGTVVTCYTVLGGMKAIIWTDVAQCCVMFCGLFATLAFIISSIPGGIEQVLDVAENSGHLSFNTFNSTTDKPEFLSQLCNYLTTEVTFVGIVLYILVGRLAAFTSDQITIQRFRTTRTYQEARNTFVVNAFADSIWVLALSGVGLALFVYYQTTAVFPAELQNDKVLPYFMSQEFPTGLIGLVIAAIAAASLSSVDSALNSTTSIIVVDFYNRLWLRRKRPSKNVSTAEQNYQVRVSRVINIFLGIIVIFIASNIENMGEIYTVANKILGAFFGTLLGIFILGMFTRKANSIGVFSGAVLGLLTSCFLSFFSELTSLHETTRFILGERFFDLSSNLSWQWPPVFGIAITIAIGYLASICLPGKTIDETPATFSAVMTTQVHNELNS